MGWVLLSVPFSGFRVVWQLWTVPFSGASMGHGGKVQHGWYELLPVLGLLGPMSLAQEGQMDPGLQGQDGVGDVACALFRVKGPAWCLRHKKFRPGRVHGYQDSCHLTLGFTF